MRILLVACALFVQLLAATPVAAASEEPATAIPADPVLALGRSLAELRAEVEGLAEEVESARAEAREEQLALARRRASLAGDLDEARLVEAEVARRVEAAKASAAARTTASDTVAAPVRDALVTLRAQVSSGLPWKARERLSRLDDVEHLLETEGPVSAAGALWRVIDDELELSSSSQLARQPISLSRAAGSDQRVVADVIRIGTVMMFFRTPRGEVGVAERATPGSGGTAASSVRWRVLDDAQERARVHGLFEAFRKGPPTTPVLIPAPPAISSEER